MQPFRLPAAGPPGAYKTYELRAPVATHFRPATCAEANCDAYLNGWRTTINETSALGQFQASYIRRESGRAFTEERLPDGMTAFTFEAGQRCFAASDHRVSLEREPLYLVRGGDWRQNQGLIRRHVDGIDWRDDFGEHQQRIADQVERG